MVGATLGLGMACGHLGYDPLGPGGDVGASDALADPCSRPEVIICDDFEAGVPAAGWMIDSEASTELGVVPGGARGSAFALQVSIPGGGNTARLIVSPTPISVGRFYLRAWLRIPAGPPLTSWAVLMEVDRAALSASEKVSLDLTPADRFQVWAPSAQVMTIDGVVTRDVWRCVELDVTFGGDGDVAQARVDGVPILDATGAIRVSFDRIMMGVLADTDPLTVFFDDVLIATTPLGCS